MWLTKECIILRLSSEYDCHARQVYFRNNYFSLLNEASLAKNDSSASSSKSLGSAHRKPRSSVVGFRYSRTPKHQRSHEIFATQRTHAFPLEFAVKFPSTFSKEWVSFKWRARASPTPCAATHSSSPPRNVKQKQGASPCQRSQLKPLVLTGRSCASRAARGEATRGSLV
jgi:hypothetical protein